MSRIALTAFLAVAALAPAQAPFRASGSPLGSLHVDKRRQADLLSNGVLYTVQWYQRGPLGRGCPRCPPDYVRGVRVAGVRGRSRIVASWESPHTTIRVFYPSLNRLWRTPGRRSDLISTALQYGGRTMAVYMLRLEGTGLRETWHWVGMNASVMMAKGRVVLVAQPEDYFQVPRLYAWTGKGFGDVSRDFPAFYAKLGARYARPIDRDAQAGVLAEIGCQLPLEAYDLAGRPELGRKACLEIRERIVSGSRVLGASRRNYPALRRRVAAKIDSLLAQQRAGRWPVEY